MEPVESPPAPTPAAPKRKPPHRKGKGKRGYAPIITDLAMKRHARAMLEAGDNASVYARTHGLSEAQGFRLSRVAGQMMLEEMANHENAPGTGPGQNGEGRRYSITLGAHALETIQNSAFQAVTFLRKIEGKPLDRLTDRELKLQARALEIISKVARLFRPLIESSGFDVIPRLPAASSTGPGSPPASSTPALNGETIGEPLPPAPEDEGPRVVGGMVL